MNYIYKWNKSYDDVSIVIKQCRSDRLTHMISHLQP